MKNIPRKEKDLMEAALQHEPVKGIFMPDGTIATKEPNRSEILDKIQGIKISKDDDEKLQANIEIYNDTLDVHESKFDDISLADNMVIVKLARMNHIDPKTKFIIKRTLNEPSRSGADVQGKTIENTYPYYDFGYVVASSSSRVPEKRFVQLSEDAIMQQFQREEGKWRYYMPNEFTFWNERTVSNIRSVNTLPCYVLIRDYQVEALFSENYKPKFNE